MPPEPLEYEPLMTPAEVAHQFKVDPKIVTRWARSGRLPTATRTLGGHRRFRASDVQALYEGSSEDRRA